MNATEVGADVLLVLLICVATQIISLIQQQPRNISLQTYSYGKVQNKEEAKWFRYGTYDEHVQ